MFKAVKITQQTTLRRWEVLEGETIEQKVERITTNNEPITDGAPIIYTDRKDGVVKAYDIRTDRWDVALDAMNTVERVNAAKRVEFYKKLDEKKANEGKPEGQQSAGGE